MSFTFLERDLKSSLVQPLYDRFSMFLALVQNSLIVDQGVIDECCAEIVRVIFHMVDIKLEHSRSGCQSERQHLVSGTGHIVNERLQGPRLSAPTYLMEFRLHVELCVESRATHSLEQLVDQKNWIAALFSHLMQLPPPGFMKPMKIKQERPPKFSETR